MKELCLLRHAKSSRDYPELTDFERPINSRGRHDIPLMADVLKKKGYDYRYVFAMNAGHVDNRVVMQTLPAALQWLWRDYPK